MIHTRTRFDNAIIALSLLGGCGGRTDDFVAADNANLTGGDSTMSSGSTVATGGSAGCTSRAETYSITTSFPFQSSADAHLYPDCTPSCGPGYDVQPSGVPTVVALPAGSCDSEATCMMAATSCACGGNVNGYLCACVNSRWSCVNASQGGGICHIGPDGGC